MRRKVTRLAACAFIGLALSAASANQNRCSLSVTPVAFGVYDGLKSSDIRTTGTITYNCTLSEPIVITINRGGGPNYDPRSMKQGPSDLEYNLYLDAAGTMIWGDGTGGSHVYRDNAPPPDTNVSIPVYGRIPAGQRQARVGFYDDKLLVKASF
ncbi:MAG: spore coat U domain-containing protein [Rhodospirillaceae bacterium]